MKTEPLRLNPNCPCTRKCVRHGNCKECRANHQNKKSPTWCMRKEEKSKKKSS